MKVYAITDEQALSNLPKTEEGKALSGFFNLPTSPAADMVMQTLGTGGDIKKLENGAALTKGKTDISLKASGNARRIDIVSNTHEMTMEIDDIDKLSGSQKGSTKMFLYILTKLNEQAFSIDSNTGEGVQRKDFISFPLEDLVKDGLYSGKDKRTALQSARKGFLNAANVLTSIKAKGKISELKGKRRTFVSAGLQVLFITMGIVNGQCIIKLHPDVNWNFIARFYTILPSWIFSLSVKALTLVYYISFLARMKTEALKSAGCFNISMRAIQYRLGLPSEIGNRKTKEKIKDVIEATITEIEDKIYEEMKATGQSGYFKITPKGFDENSSIKEYLDNGYLEIKFSGDYEKYFIDIADNKHKLREADNKRKRKVEDTAKAKALQKTIEKEMKKESKPE